MVTVDIRRDEFVVRKVLIQECRLKRGRAALVDIQRDPVVFGKEEIGQAVHVLVFAAERVQTLEFDAENGIAVKLAVTLPHGDVVPFLDQDRRKRRARRALLWST